MAKTVTVIKRPDCALCKEKTPAHYDAQTIFGSWAYLCCTCFLKYTRGKLGTGVGQRLILVNK